MLVKKIHLTLLGSLCIAVSSGFAQIVTVPYSNDFTNNVSDFTSSGDWALNTATGTYTVDVPTIATRVASNITTDGFALADFIVTTSFTVNSTRAPNAVDSDFGLVLFGNSNSLGQDYVLFDMSDFNNRLRIFNVRNGGTYNNGNQINVIKENIAVPFALGQEYTLTVTGVFTGDNLGLTLSVTNGTLSDSISGTITDFAIKSAFGKDLVGLGVRAGNVSLGNPVNVSYSSLAVIPEPSTYAMLIGGILAMVCLRRRLCK